MVDERIIYRLRQQNPWWGSPDWTGLDPHLAELAVSPFVWHPLLLGEIDLGRPSIYTIRGPRQVGKTTLLKMLIRDRLAAGLEPDRLLYYSLDLERDPEGIVEFVRTAKSLARSKGPWCIFLDEVSTVSGWQRAVKFLRDQTDASKDCFILTGSSASDIRAGAERLPGRRGPGGRFDKVMLPMTFTEYCSVTGTAEASWDRMPIEAFLSPKGIGSWVARVEELDTALVAYGATGGFPRAVKDRMMRGEVQPETLETLWVIVAGDADRAGRDRVAVLRLLERVVRSLGSPMSWLAMAQDAGFEASRTAEQYAGFLADSYVLLILYALELGRGPASRKQKKLYPVDPLFARLPHFLDPGAPDPDPSKVVEALVAAALYRAIEPEPVESFRLPQRLYYWRSTSGREVDFVVPIGRRNIPIEVKYGHRISGKDREAIFRSFGKGIILSRTAFSLEGPVPVIPTAVFLALMKGAKQPR